MKIKRSLMVFLSWIIAVCTSVPAMASDWPQFLGTSDFQGISEAYTAENAGDLSLRWEKNTGSTWTDVPGTPVVVGEYVYYYSSEHLHKLELATGKEVASVRVYGEPINQFFINIAYDDGKIFVPCQKDNLDDGLDIKGCFIRVYSADTLEQLYVTESFGSGQFQSPIMYNDGHVVTGVYGRNGIYAGFTTADEDIAVGSEVKKLSWTVNSESKYGYTFSGACFVGDYCYFGCNNILSVVNYKNGEIRSFYIGEGHRISSTVVYSNETKRLYVSSNHPEGHAAVFSYELGTDGMPVEETALKWISDVDGGGTQSTPVIYRGRLYIGGGGHTMGSNEPFHVIDAHTMKEIYSVPILTKASAAVSTAYAREENNYKVYIYMVPYAPNFNDASEMWIISDSMGQTEAKYEIAENIGRSQYCSQSVAIASDGALIWYNDGGYLYCYENGLGIFADTQNHWAREDIAYVAQRKTVNGVGNNLFNPDGKITRAQFVQILANMSGEDFAHFTADAFSDVSTQWFAPAVAWAVQNKIVDTDSNLYMPNEPINREDMALMLYRYVANVAKTKLKAVSASVDFADKGVISEKAREAVSAMQQSGIISGISEGSGIYFSPQNQATRAQASAMIARFYKAIK